jgi:class 3 adenylate cyclase/CHASE3 domain sensor protein
VNFFARLHRPLSDFVARLPVRLELKLLAAFLGAVAMLVLLGAAGLAVASANGRRTDTLIETQQRIDSYQHLEHYSHVLMVTLASALWMPGKISDIGTEQIDHLKENLAALHPASPEEAAQVEEIRRQYTSFLDLVNRQIGLLRSGDVDHAAALQIDQVLPQSAKIEHLTDQLVDQADAEMKQAVDATHAAYRASRNGLIAFIIGVALFGIYLAHAIASFVVEPLSEVGERLSRIAAGEFGQRVTVPNRDEIGALAENVNRTSEQLGQLYADIEVEKERSEQLLYNMLPRQIVQRIANGETLIADRVPAATILFSDIVGFTEISRHLAPEEVVDMLDVLFSRYDALSDRFELEKIKTIGDAYMVAAGLLEPREDHPIVIAEMALAMRAATDIASRALGVIGRPLQVRIGMDSGPLIAGVLGARKLVYDVWGDTVNTASRMEHYSEVGKIAVTAGTRELLGNRFRFETREPIEVKGKGMMETFFLERRIGPSLHRGRSLTLADARYAAA